MELLRSAGLALTSSIPSPPRKATSMKQGMSNQKVNKVAEMLLVEVWKGEGSLSMRQIIYLSRRIVKALEKGRKK